MNGPGLDALVAPDSGLLLGELVYPSGKMVSHKGQLRLVRILVHARDAFGFGCVVESVLPTKAIEIGKPRQHLLRFFNRLEDEPSAVIHSAQSSWGYSAVCARFLWCSVGFRPGTGPVQLPIGDAEETSRRP